jgi:hypothetical protein
VLTGGIKTLAASQSGKVFGLSFELVDNGRTYKVSWLGLSAEADLAAAEGMLRQRQPANYAVRQTSRVKEGMTYLNLEIAGLPKAA